GRAGAPRPCDGVPPAPRQAQRKQFPRRQVGPPPPSARQRRCRHRPSPRLPSLDLERVGWGLLPLTLPPLSARSIFPKACQRNLPLLILSPRRPGREGRVRGADELVRSTAHLTLPLRGP